jgi:hypothetical protein
MMRDQIKLLIFAGIVALLSLSCDGLFPTQSKPTISSDHTVNRSGALHKPGLADPWIRADAQPQAVATLI